MAEHDHEDEFIYLGACCVCFKVGPTVRNLFSIYNECAVVGHGWGCLGCGLPPNGAIAVLCDDCIGPLDEKGRPTLAKIPIFACRGWPGTDGREPIEMTYARPEFKHDDSRHPEVWAQ